MTNRFKSPSTLVSFVCIALLLFLPRIVLGQVSNVADDTSTPIPGAGHDYIKMINETVNPANGSVSVRISVPVPQSRGFTLPFAFAYDSDGVLHLDGYGAGAGWDSSGSYFSSNGWAYTLPLLASQQGSNSVTIGQPPETTTSTCWFETGYVFQDPGGGRHALHLAVSEPIGGTCGRDNIPTPTPGNYLSGGDDQYQAVTTAWTNPGQYGPIPAVTVSTADGTVFNFPSSTTIDQAYLPTSIVDRNNNQAQITGQPTGAFTVQDTAGREITGTGFGHTGDQITPSGLGAYTLTWETLTPSWLTAGQDFVGPQDPYGNLCGFPAPIEPATGTAWTVVKSIQLPNGQSYSFSYDPVSGYLSQITYPTGGSVRYAWGLNTRSEWAGFADSSGHPGFCNYHYDTPAITDRWVNDGTKDVLHQHFTYSTTWDPDPTKYAAWDQKTTQVTTYDLQTGSTYDTYYTYGPAWQLTQPSIAGMSYSTEIPVESEIDYYPGAMAQGNPLQIVKKTWFTPYSIQSETKTLGQGGPTAETDYNYNWTTAFNLLSDVFDHDYGGALLRQTHTDYDTSVSNGIYDRPLDIIISAGGGEVAETDYTNDTTNGNARSKKQRCLNNCTGEADAITGYVYDSKGQVTSMTDPRQNITYYYYDSNDLYVTQIKYPPTNSVAHNVEFQHNSETGLMTQSTDQNGQTTNYYYTANGQSGGPPEPLDRLTGISYPDGGNTTYGYGGNACGQPSSTITLIQGASTYNESATLDGLCQVTQTTVISDPDGPHITDTTYDGSGRVWKKSNPHRGGGSSTDGTTTYTYDALGRVTLTVPPDGTAQLNHVATVYAGNRTTVTDQTGRQRGYVHDALGRIIEADEPGTAQIAPTAISSEDPSNSGALAQAVAESQTWLASQQAPGASTWEGNALATQSSPQFQESGIYSATDLSTLPQTPIENIVIDPPAGVTPDNSTGLDGFPINYSPSALPQGNVFLNVYPNPSTAPQTLTGHCFSLLNPAPAYRVDLYTRADVFYYQGPASLVSTGASTATWTFNGWIGAGPVLAVLYPTSVPQPAPGSAFSAIPAGWIVHSNSGVGKKLTGYKAMLFVDTDMEYLQEDNVPIIVQDGHHARAGSSVIPPEGAGKLTVQVAYNDPVAGYVTVYDSLETLAGLQGLPLSFDIPTNDPLYVPPPGFLGEAAMQNRSFIYDDALTIIAYSAAGDYGSASDIIQQLNYRVDNPDYMSTRMLENAEDGLTSNWSATNGTVTNIYDPTEPPYGSQVLDFHANASGATFTYVGSQLPDLSDTMISFEHKEPSTTGSNYVYDIGVTSSAGMVTDVLVTSDTPTLPTYNSASQTITIPIGLGSGAYGTTLENLSALISSLTGDKSYVHCRLQGDARLWQPRRHVLQQPERGEPATGGSLSFSYDVYNGNADQAYIRAGAMAWVVYAYCMYMQQSQDYTPALYVQKMINFLETLKSSASDLTNSLYYMGWGMYQNPGYQYVPGLQQTVSTEHQGDIYFAYKLAAGVLPTAATQLLQQNQITPAQANFAQYHGQHHQQ